MEDPAEKKEALTDGIQITVQPVYVEERSAPERSYWFFAYHIEITNLGQQRAQLLSRVWHITNGNGDVETVEGPGVVGEQPVLDPGASFQYTSYCPLNTAVGSMAGIFRMVRPDGQTFDAEVPCFTLAAPHSLN